MIGERLSQDPSGATSPRVWLYLASAYGQRYTALKASNADPAELEPVRAKALEAVRKALQFDRRNNLPILQMLSQVRYPGKPANENDLEVFADDPDFTKLLAPDPDEAAAPQPRPVEGEAANVVERPDPDAAAAEDERA